MKIVGLPIVSKEGDKNNFLEAGGSLIKMAAKTSSDFSEHFLP